MEVVVLADGNPIQGTPINLCANDTLTISCNANNLPPGVKHHQGCDKDWALIRGELEKADRRLMQVLDLFESDDRGQVEELIGLSPTDTFVARNPAK